MLHNRFMEQLIVTKPSIGHHLHSPQFPFIFHLFPFSSLERYGMMLFLYLVVLHLGSTTTLFDRVLIVFSLFVNREFDFLASFLANLRQSCSRLISSGSSSALLVSSSVHYAILVQPFLKEI